MTEKYFKRESALFMVNMENYKVYMLIGDCWVRITDPEIRATIRLRASEIPKAEAMALVVSHQNAPLPPMVEAPMPWMAPRRNHPEPSN